MNEDRRATMGLISLTFAVGFASNALAAPSAPGTDHTNKQHRHPQGRTAAVADRELFDGSVEQDTKIPAIKRREFRSLPMSNIKLRREAFSAVSHDIRTGTLAALHTYSQATDLESGWDRIVIPRPSRLFGDAESVVLLRIKNDKKSVEIAVRGTANFADAIEDLKAKAAPDAELEFRLHSGFRSIAKSIFSYLEATHITKIMLADYEFSLYGHSLGGSVASILSMYLYERGATIRAVVTFGAPRFTTNEGSRKYQALNKVTHRIVRCDDVVPFLPPPNFFGWSNESYQANGNIFLLLDPPYFDYSVGIDIERDFSYQLRVDLQNNAKFNSLAFGHRMQNYAELLSRFGTGGPDLGKTGFDSLKPVSYTLKHQANLCPKNL